MKFTVHYVPLKKIKTGSKVMITDRLKKLRTYMLDCMNVMVVKKNQKEDSYSLIYGLNQYQYLQKYSNKKYVPCIIDESEKKSWGRLVQRFQNSTFMDIPLSPKSWSIVHAFLKEEPRFQKLTFTEKMKVILLAVRYKRTVIQSMKNKIDELNK